MHHKVVILLRIKKAGAKIGRTVVQEQKEILGTDHSILLSLLQSRIGNPLVERFER